VRRLLILFTAQLVLWILVGQLNHQLTGWRVYLFPAALYVAYAALLQTWRAGFTASILAGLLCDATSPVAFGTHACLFAAAHATLHHLRDRLPREDTVGQVVIVLLVNLGLFLGFSLTQIHAAPVPSQAWGRLLVDLVCSQVFLAFITPWFFALQARALVLARVERENFA
jgi:rod shape-determining protein MreD